MLKKFKLQVQKEKYFDEYDDLLRFISYFYQVDITRRLKPKKVLEIGIGNKMVSSYLENHGIQIETCDFDKELKPDYIADIRNLPLKDNSYELIIACEVLEHIPWQDVDKALSEMQRVTKKYVLISIPYSSAGFELIMKFPGAGKIMKKPFFDLFFRIPYFFMDIKFSGEHYWEMGRKKYPAIKIRREFKKYFKIVKEIRPVINSYHHFFILEKK